MKRTSEAPSHPGEDIRAGDQVICVDDCPTTCAGRQELAKGQVYTVTQVFHAPACRVEYGMLVDVPCVILKEVKGFCCGHFPARRFQRAPDISVFQLMLTGADA